MFSKRTERVIQAIMAVCYTVAISTIYTVCMLIAQVQR
jgi:hypothetical protein